MVSATLTLSSVPDLDGLAMVRLEKMARLVAREARKDLGLPAPPPSRPGQTPHRQSGLLAQSVVHTIGGAARTASVEVMETVAPHAALLESGTVRMARRPVLERTLVRLLPDLTRIAMGG